MDLFDSHCHLNAKAFDNDRDDILATGHQLGLSGLCIPSTIAAEWESLLSLAKDSSQQQDAHKVRQYVALGIHPCFLSRSYQEKGQKMECCNELERLDQLLSQKPVGLVAVGETGLDFHDRELSDDQREHQQRYFSEQLRLAGHHGLPVIIHARKSHDRILGLLRKYSVDRGGIIHAFSGSEQQAQQYIERGFKLGFGGGITYPRARKTRHLAATLPLDAIVLETDAPDMPLNGFQGQRNSPKHLPAIAHCLAGLRQQPVKEIAEATTRNCKTLFDIDSF